MTVVLGSRSIISEPDTAAGYTLSLHHDGAGSSTAINSIERLRTRQLADAFRYEWDYPGTVTQGSTIIRVTPVTGSMPALQLLAMLSIDCEDLDSFQVRWRARNGGGTVIWTGTQTPVYPVRLERGIARACHVVAPLSALPTAASLELEIRPTLTSTAALTTFIDVGRLWLTEAWESEWPIAAGWSESFSEDGLKGYSRGRQAYADSEAVYRTVSFGLSRMSLASKEALKNFFSRVGTTREILFATRQQYEVPDNDPGLLYGSFSQPLQIQRQAGPYFKADAAITEEF